MATMYSCEMSKSCEQHPTQACNGECKYIRQAICNRMSGLWPQLACSQEVVVRCACCTDYLQRTSRSRILCSMSPYSASSWRVLSLW